MQIITDYESRDMKYIIDIYIRRNNDQQWFTCNLSMKYWMKHELVPWIVTQQLDYKKHCAKSTGWWWLFTLTAGDLQKLNLHGSQKKSLIFPQSQPLWSSWVFFVSQLGKMPTFAKASHHLSKAFNLFKSLSLVE